MAVLPNELRPPKDEFDWAYLTASILIAGVVGLGEALVAVYFMGTVGLSAFFIVGSSAFIVNFLLFRSDTFDFFKSFGDGEFFKDAEHKEFTGASKIILLISMVLAIFAGASSGFLQLNSILTTFGALFWGLSAATAIVAPPIGLMIVGCVVATISAIANMALLYFNVEKFIRKKEYQKFVDIFYSIFSVEHDTPNSNQEKLSFGWKIYHGLFLLFGLVCAVGVYVVSLGLFQAQAFTVFNSFCNFSARTSNILTYIFVHATGQLLNGFFYVRNMLNAVEFLSDIIKESFVACYDVACKFFAHEQQSSSLEHNVYIIPWRSLLSCFNASLIFIVLFYLSVQNGLAQGQGAMTEPRSIAWFTSLQLPGWLSEKLAFLLMFVGSTSANAFACWDEIKPDTESVNRVKKFMGFMNHSKDAEEMSSTTRSETAQGIEHLHSPVIS